MSLTTLWISLRALHFMALLLLAGSAFYTALLAPLRYRSLLAQHLGLILASSAVLSLLSSVLMLATQTGLMSGDWRNISDPDTWQAVLQTRFGVVWRWEIGFALLSALSLLLKGTLRQKMLLLSSLLQLIALAGVGHAAMRDSWTGVLQQANHALHLIAAAFWAGGLVPLLLLMRDARHTAFRRDAIRCMMRFSRYGHLAVALALLTGIMNSLLIAGSPLNWQATLWSKLLIVKVLLVMLMVLIALVNRYLLVPRFRLATSDASPLFIRLTQLELLLAMGVIGLVSVFATLSPA
ncbi:copper homeostasis membrane protein CopD [Candidatus Pantoea floridensis]|uniref:Copper resistance protein D n=1 Tax=Candidatus Pantoea floridensis TaxID=1938870 RepID=A0A286BYS0_9GAMM|nr:copper homeostasis membrane protein CopD [Pantoea floridensis]PIF21748.1 putative copper resistance protein D [Enterobacteriaceae bacterium JKS000233]SOD39258.1 putative copper resistance protein D [Pantoea floridensis]